MSGAELAIADMVAKRSGDFAYVMLAPGEGKLADYYRTRGFPVWACKLQTRRRLFPGLHSLQSFWFARQLKRAGVDAVLCNTFPAASRVGTACRLARKPHAIYVREYIRNISLHQNVLAQADMVVAVSWDVANYLKDFVPPKQIVVAYDHLDTTSLTERVRVHRASGKRFLPFGSGHPVVGFMGRITAYKQPDLFLRAIPKVIQKQPNARFVVVGAAVERGREYEAGLKRLANDLGVADYVAFMGHRSDAVEILSDLAVLCLTSDREPFPRTVLEAQAIGCPVVVSDTGGCLEMVKDGVTGLLFQVAAPNAAEGLADQVIRVLSDGAMSSALAKQAMATVHGSVGSRAPVTSLEAHLRSIVGLK